jgi:hypothetical protein
MKIPLVGAELLLAHWQTEKTMLNQTQLIVAFRKFTRALNKMKGMYYDSVEITNKMQPCNRIYYSTVHWRLNMFRAAYRSSSGALTAFAAFALYTHVVTGRSQVWVLIEKMRRTLCLPTRSTDNVYVEVP